MEKKLNITPEQKEVLFGTLLGDGWLESTTGGKTYRFGFKQKREQEDYVKHVWLVLQSLCQSDPIQNGRCFQLKTLALGNLRFYGHQFYGKQNTKQVPKLIHRWLTPRALAYWYMDDGYKDKTNACLLCTDSFEKRDVQRLIDALYRNFKYKCHLRKKQLTHKCVWRIYIPSEYGSDFRQLVLPHMVESMIYKLPSQ